MLGAVVECAGVGFACAQNKMEKIFIDKKYIIIWLKPHEIFNN